MQAGSPFVGLKQYRSLFDDSDVAGSWANTLWIGLIAVAIETIAGVAIALLLNRTGGAQKWLLAATIFPAIPPVVNALIWTWIYNPSYGLLNDLLLRVGAIDHNIAWFNSRPMGLLLIAVVHAWRMTPLMAVLILAALQGIPDELYQAGRLDGAGPLRMFWSITLPLISPVLALAITQATVDAINLFDEFWILAGQSLDTRTLLIEVYILAFNDMGFSYGMALSVVMIVTLLLSVYSIMRLYRDTGQG